MSTWRYKRPKPKKFKKFLGVSTWGHFHEKVIKWWKKLSWTADNPHSQDFFPDTSVTRGAVFGKDVGKNDYYNKLQTCWDHLLSDLWKKKHPSLSFTPPSSFTPLPMLLQCVFPRKDNAQHNIERGKGAGKVSYTCISLDLKGVYILLSCLNSFVLDCRVTNVLKWSTSLCILCFFVLVPADLPSSLSCR